MGFANIDSKLLGRSMKKQDNMDFENFWLMSFIHTSCAYTQTKLPTFKSQTPVHCICIYTLY